MGGGAPKNLFLSPAGGWFFIPKNYRTNSLYIGLGFVAVSFLTYQLGKKTTVVSNKEIDDDTITRWNSAAKKARENSAISNVAGR